MKSLKSVVLHKNSMHVKQLSINLKAISTEYLYTPAALLARSNCSHSSQMTIDFFEGQTFAFAALNALLIDLM